MLGLTKVLNLQSQFSPMLNSLTRMLGSDGSGINLDMFTGKLHEILPLIKQVMDKEYDS